MMKITVILLLAFAAITFGAKAKNFLGTEFHNCAKCLCHAVSGCYIRQNCARYSISEDYWIEAGSPTVDDKNNELSYKRCMANENCILATIYAYIEKHKMDCNCDGKTDCKDFLAIHLSGTKCRNPKYGDVKAQRFNNCAKMFNLPTVIMKKEEQFCEVEVV